MVALLERGTAGSFNATGPATPIAMRKVLETCRAVTGADASFEWIDEKFLDAQSIVPWKDMPLWVPEPDPEASHFMNVPIDRAVAAGLRWRPLEETVADTLAWEQARPAGRELKAGLAPSREVDLLSAWTRR